MPEKTLSIVETAYRATLEEQDDPVLWLMHAMKGAGADLDVLLRGNAVNYAVEGQDASGLSFGGKRQTQPPRIDREIATLTAKGVQVLVVEEDLIERGIDRSDLIKAVKTLPQSELAGLLRRYDQVWHW